MRVGVLEYTLFIPGSVLIWGGVRLGVIVVGQLGRRLPMTKRASFSGGVSALMGLSTYCLGGVHATSTAPGSK